MTHEIDLYGVFVPDLLVWALVAYGLAVPVRRIFGRLGLYRLVWHRALFDAAVYVLLLGGTAALARGFAS
ncbi:DUF1656 domain-containing protein [Lichenibacterium minor]|uniref:DUF1656 domain-containing protein n=1 Tax=Lichenibacterium minor TaxID=2316528 RepID=A0A4Q2U4S1_9HYPH|nr:DUF1656 domain-containing protein [Lichenibacterium minor]RYC29917.1 DUF1656 domain-containing protein [Lichenibacterium minor]